MQAPRTVLALAVLALAAGAAQAKSVSPDDIKKALDANPSLILDVLKSHKKEFFEVWQQAYQEEQVRRAQEEREAEEKEIDDSIKNPKVAEIGSKSHVRGKKGAKYTLVEYSDFQCPYCGRGFRTVEELRKKYGGDLRFIYKNDPLPMHPMAMPAAQYFEAASMQSSDKAWALHDKMFENQDKLSDDFIKSAAKELGLDVAKLEKDSKSDGVKERIAADQAEAQKFGFNGTPGFLINGVPVRGAYPPDFFDGIIKKLQAKK